MADVIERLAGYDALAAAGADGRTPPLRRYLVLDVFADGPLQGNPLAVFTDGRGIEPGRMQEVARELNLSETVFLLPPEDGGDARARIFTPSSELPFAGHPVLGSAIVAAGALGQEGVTLETGSGPVWVALEPGGGRGRYGRMEQPLPSWAPYERPDELLAALGLERSELPVEAYTNGPRHVYVGVATDAQLAGLAPNMGALAALGAFGASCFCGSGLSWRTRVFAPGLGVPEDPATGSAAGPLAVHLARHGLIRYGDQIEIRQGEEIGRPSRLHALVEGSSRQLERVEVGGHAVVVADGWFAF